MTRIIFIILLFSTLDYSKGIENKLEFSNGDVITYSVTEKGASLIIIMKYDKKQTTFSFSKVESETSLVIFDPGIKPTSSSKTINQPLPVMEPLRQLLTDRHPEDAVQIYTYFMMFY